MIPGMSCLRYFVRMMASILALTFSLAEPLSIASGTQFINVSLDLCACVCVRVYQQGMTWGIFGKAASIC